MGLPVSMTVDDLTVEPATGYGPDLTQKIPELAQYCVSQLKAGRWAHQDVTFLVFDKTDVVVNDELGIDQPKFESVYDDQEGSLDRPRVVLCG